MFGPLSSLSATSGKWQETTTTIGDDRQPLKDVAPIKYLEPDLWSVSGSLALHPGAIFSGTWRSGLPVSDGPHKGRPSLILLIDGSEGYIRVEASGISEGQLHIAGAGGRLWLNGEEQQLNDDPLMVGNTGRNWAEYAKGREGDYPTWDDAIVIHKHLDAIEQSAATGNRVKLSLT